MSTSCCNSSALCYCARYSTPKTEKNNATLVPFRISRDVAWSLSLLIVVLRIVDALNIIHLVSTTSAERCTYCRVCVLVGQYLQHVETNTAISVV